MKKFLFATLMGVLVALVGCQQDDELTGVENTLGKKVSVTANIKANAQSRVAMEYNDEGDEPIIKVEWKASGESFLMLDATDLTVTPTTFIQTSGNQFEGTLPSESGSYIAVYGNSDMLANQDGTLKEDYVCMSAQVTDLTQPIDFEHSTAVLKPKFVNSSSILNSSITKIVMDGVNIVENITLTPSSLEDIFIFLPASLTYFSGSTFNFEVNAGNDKYAGSLSISKDIEAGKFYTATIELEEVIPYVTFTADATQYLSYDGSDLQYSKDGTTFQNLTADTPIEFGGDTKLYLCGVNNLDGTFKELDAQMYKLGYNISFSTDVLVECTGDIRTLLDAENYKTVVTSGASFPNLFKNCWQLKSAPALPAEELAEDCYSSMFEGCNSLIEAPALPATTLAEKCYASMFKGCVALVEAPELKATTMVEKCYAAMFKGCIKLEEAPDLPSETLAYQCYNNMFANCNSLVNAPELPAMTLAEACYSYMFAVCTALEEAPALPATTLAEDCYCEMFRGCSSLVTAPILPATTLTSGCYSGMFRECYSLVESPELKATTLVQFCYSDMFRDCSSLNKITMLATAGLDISNALSRWVMDVATEGTFNKASSAVITPDSENGIPTGWTVNNQ